MADTTKERKLLICGNCGFVGNAHELEVHAAIRHYICDDPDCSACDEREIGLGARG